jgi:hypothetical protein
MHKSCSCATVELAAWREGMRLLLQPVDMNKKARLSRLSRLVHHAMDNVSDLI